MTFSLSLCIALLPFLLQEDAAVPLQLFRNGAPAINQFCVGDNITMVCSLQGTFHGWDIMPFGVHFANGGIDIFDMPRIIGYNNEFTLAVVDRAPNSFISSISFIGFLEFNGTYVQCYEPYETSEDQVITIYFLGLPSSPSIAATGNLDFESFHVVIQPPRISPECVLQYHLVVFEENILLRRINVTANGVINVAGLDLCTHIYYFVVFAQTAIGDGASTSFVEGQVDFPANLFQIMPEVDGARTTSTQITLKLSTVFCHESALTASINSNGQVIQSVKLSIFSTLITFSSLATGTYQCNVSVLSIKKRLIFSEVINCSTSGPTENYTLAGTQLICIAADNYDTDLFAFIAGVLCGIIALVCIYVVKNLRLKRLYNHFFRT